MNRKLSIFIFLTLACLLGLTNCTAVLSGLYGLNKIKNVDENSIIQYSESYNIPNGDNYILDTSFLSFLFSHDTIKYKSQIKNHYQPLQALYYAKSEHLISFQVNCYAGGFPNLKWNRHKTMTTFPPKQQAPVDSIVSLETQLKYLKPLSNTENISIDSYDYIVIVYWSIFMGRQSKRFIRYIQDNCKLEPEMRVKIIYANIDNLFATE
jgi:hypothetical protein